MEEKVITPQEEVDSLVKKALKCLDEYASFTQEQIDYIVAKASVAALDHHGSLAKLAIEETKRGVFEDKATKNLFACEYVVNNMRHLKTVGIIEDDEVTGIVKVAEPVESFSLSTQMLNNHQLLPRKSSMMPRLQLEHQKTAFNGLKISQWKQLIA